MKLKRLAVLFTILSVFCVTPIEAIGATSAFKIYTVHKGDTLYAIAKAHGTTVNTLRQDNHIRNVSQIQIGQRINIRKTSVYQKTKIKKVIHATLTAYTAGIESTGKTPSHPAYGITSSGARVREGRTIAVDPNVIPIGATVYIEGVGIRVAEDTGSAIRGAKIDVYMENVHEARQFGVKRNRKVYVLSTTI